AIWKRNFGTTPYLQPRRNSDPGRCQRPRGANASCCAGPLDRRTPVGDLHHTVCKSNRISPAIRAREVLATGRGESSAVVVETTDSRVEEAHPEEEMDVVCASASPLARQARG